MAPIGPGWFQPMPACASGLNSWRSNTMETLKQAAIGALIGAIGAVSFFATERAVIKIADILPVKGEKK